ncbi:MAG TPA: LamG domain-containing protein [Polyangiaceae bacterium]|nr:LamG domain-containing protein [Polyangiaceae bacterium]
MRSSASSSPRSLANLFPGCPAGSWLCLLLAWPTLACGSQFTDPILSELSPAPSASNPPATQSPGAGGQPAEAPANPPGGSPSPACVDTFVARFDGSVFASTPRLIQDDFTIEAWLATTVSPSGNGFDDGSALVFADVEKVGTDDFGLALLSSRVVMSIGAPDTAATSTSSVATGEWAHVAVTRAKATGLVLIFVNGVLEASVTASTRRLAGNPTLSIGGRPGRNLYVGLLSELRLWTTVRSQAELLGSMRQRLTGEEAGLVGYYRLDASEGTSAVDSSPSHNDAAFTGPVTWEQAPVPLCAAP